MLAVASSASACWDGGELSTDRVYIANACSECGGWDAEEAHTLATWTTRIEAILPDGYEVARTPSGELMMCRDLAHRSSGAASRKSRLGAFQVS